MYEGCGNKILRLGTVDTCFISCLLYSNSFPFGRTFFRTLFFFRFGTTCEIELRGKEVASHVLLAGFVEIKIFQILHSANPVGSRQRLP